MLGLYIINKRKIPQNYSKTATKIIFLISSKEFFKYFSHFHKGSFSIEKKNNLFSKKYK